MWESRAVGEIPTSRWKPCCGFHGDDISIVAVTVGGPDRVGAAAAVLSQLIDSIAHVVDARRRRGNTGPGERPRRVAGGPAAGVERARSVR